MVLFFRLIIFGDFRVENVSEKSLDDGVKHFERRFGERIGVRSVEINTGHFFEEGEKRVWIVLSINDIGEFILFFEVLENFFLIVFLLVEEGSLDFGVGMWLVNLFILLGRFAQFIGNLIKEFLLFGCEILSDF